MTMPSPPRPIQCVYALALSMLTGCASTNWDRAYYDGFQRCKTNQTADHAPCPPPPGRISAMSKNANRCWNATARRQRWYRSSIRLKRSSFDKVLGLRD